MRNWTLIVPTKVWKFCCAAAAGLVCIAIWLATEPYRDRLKASWEIERQTAHESEMREAFRYRTPWMPWWPKPETRIHIASPFGHFSIPFAYIAGRDELAGNPNANFGPVWLPSPDRSYQWSSFAIAFWMPDGAGVVTEPGELSNHFQIDPVDLNGHRAPFRPQEAGRLDPTQDRFVVVVELFCPQDGKKLGPKHEGVSLSFTGLGMGDMNDCSIRTPPPEWHQVTTRGPGQTKIFCRPGYDICFGWIDVADFGEMALTYFPSDALDRLPEIAARLEERLRSWKDSYTAP